MYAIMYQKKGPHPCVPEPDASEAGLFGCHRTMLTHLQEDPTNVQVQPVLGQCGQMALGATKCWDAEGGHDDAMLGPIINLALATF